MVIRGQASPPLLVVQGKGGAQEIRGNGAKRARVDGPLGGFYGLDLMITELNERSREIFRRIVDAYMETGSPVGSQTVSKLLNATLSPATIRGVMADLEETGLLFSPHTSAGRLPTDLGLRLYVDGFMEVGNISPEDRTQLDSLAVGSGRSVEGLLSDATSALSGLAQATGLVMAPKTESPLRHIEFLPLNPGRALAVMVTENGIVENRVIETPADLPASALVEASNFLSARLAGRTLAEAREGITAELAERRAHLDQLTQSVVESGLATWSGEGPDWGEGALIVRGQAHLLEDVTQLAELEKIRGLFKALEKRETMLNVLELADRAEGVQIFIGADDALFNVAGCSMVVGPYRNEQNRVIGAIGVIGPTRINYSRIIPMVDYTAKMISRLIG